MRALHVIIMAGGSGTRFWPWSRRDRPKQLLALMGDVSMLSRSVARVLRMDDVVQIDVITTRPLLDATRDELLSDPSSEACIAHRDGRLRVIDEPESRNTAACIAFACALCPRPDTLLAVLPADHFIGDDDRFLDDLRDAAAIAARGGIVTIGVPPTRPETGYGYLQIAARNALPPNPGPHGASSADGTSGSETGRAQRVLAFHEKPDAERAAIWLLSGNYLWNAGIFVATVGALEREFVRQMPTMADGIDAMRTLLQGHAVDALPDEISAALTAIYSTLPATSLDYGIMEGAECVWTIQARFPWSDVGTWEALPSVMATDADDNVLRGDTFVLDSARSVVIGEGGRLVAAIGLRDMVVVDTHDAVLVLPRAQAQDLRKLVAALAIDHEDLL